MSFRRKPESIYFNKFWTPAFAGVTLQETFFEIIKYGINNVSPGKTITMAIQTMLAMKKDKDLRFPLVPAPAHGKEIKKRMVLINLSQRSDSEAIRPNPARK